MTILATLPTLDESGVAVRQTGGWDPHRGIQISDALAGGPQPAGVAPSAPIVAPRPLDKGKGATSSASTGTSALGSSRGSEEERRRQLHRADWSFVSDPPRSVRGLLVGSRRSAPKPRARRDASVRRHHHHRAHRHHHHHRHRSRRHHHHLGVIFPRGTRSSNSNNSSSSKSGGRLASRVAAKSRAPSECSPFFPLAYLSCRRVLTHPLLVRASSPCAPKVAPPPPDTMPASGSGSQ
jgi:hypothetical protein